MCGIFGYSGKDPVDVLRLKWIASENESRGDDSTGVYGNHLAKSILASKKFINTDEFEDAVTGAKTIIGHTRKATMGAKIQANAHPFEVAYKDKSIAVVGTHNGQLFQTVIDKLSAKYDVEKTDVDSEFLYKMLVHHNFDYDAALSEIEGMMALAFVRPEFPDILYLYRRHTRPLHVGYINNNLYYSSELEPLDLIGCAPTVELLPDNLYVFKNGGLLEVSPVKKSQLNITTLDVGIQTWLTTATEKEKAVVGILGAAAKKEKTAHDHHKHQNHTHVKSHRNTGFGEEKIKTEIDGGQSTLFPGTNSQLLPDLVRSAGIYTDEFFVRPPSRGRFFDSGDNYGCYCVIGLHRTDDEDLVLPGWAIRVKGHPEINCITTHSGIGLLHIPVKLCAGELPLELFTPLLPNVIYSTKLKHIESGRVLEVALNIPFPGTEEAKKADHNQIFETFAHSISFRELQRCASDAYKFKNFAYLVKELQPILQPILRTTGWGCFPIQKGLGNECRLLLPPANTSEKPTTTIRGGYSDGRRDREYKFQLDASPALLNFEYDPKTDILTDMDLYTTSCNLDELEAHSRKIKESLSSVVIDEDEIRRDLASLDSFLDYLTEYMKTRVKALKAQSDGPTDDDDEINEAMRYAQIG